MPKYDLDDLGPQKFEELSQSLVQEIIGEGAKVYGMGRDGAREATFSGQAQYPSEEERWQGDWIFQAKYHDVMHIGPKKSRSDLLRDLEDELNKITKKYEYSCDNFILITNVPLSPVYQKGTKDKIDKKIIPKFEQEIEHIHVWGAEEICRLLDSNTDIRQSYLDFLVPGDIIAHLLESIEKEKTELDELVQLYCEGCYNQEKYAALDDAGDVEEDRVSLQELFVDLEVKSKPPPENSDTVNNIPEWLKQASSDSDRTSALSYLLDDSIRNLVLIGGPGEGKTTLGQYLAQIHRSRLLGRLDELDENRRELEDCIPRIPLRILLKDYAETVASNNNSKSLFHYLSNQFTKISGRKTSTEQLQTILKSNPTLLILDGLDEVAETDMRTKVIDNVTSFVNQVRNVFEGDIKIVASTRPYSYSEEFNPTNYLHLKLQKFSPEKATKYTQLWSDAREQNSSEKDRIKNTFSECLDDKVVKALTRTPLQVTILLVIIRARGNLPKQREELFHKYMEIIYQREQKKSPELLRTDRDVIYGLHKYLACILQKRAKRDQTAALMEISEFEEKVEDYLNKTKPFLDERDRKNKADQIIKEARQRLVLIKSPQKGKVGFGLTTTREYFAAAYLVDTAENTYQRDSRFKTISTSPHWRNVALFFAGRVGRTRPGEVPSLIDICREIDDEEPDNFLKRGARFVIEMLEDRVVRMDHHKLGAIKFGLTFLDKETEELSDDLISKLKGLQVDAKEKVIRPWLEEKLRKNDPEDVKPYFETYKKLFGIDKLLREVLKQTAEGNSSTVKIWALKKSIENEINQPFVKALLKQLAKEEPPEEIAKILNFSLSNIQPYLDFKLPLTVGKTLALSLLHSIGPDPQAPGLAFQRLKELVATLELENLDLEGSKSSCKNIEESQKSSVLIWGTAFVGMLSRVTASIELHDFASKDWVNTVSFPALVNPRVKKIIKEKEDYIEAFCDSFSESEVPFIDLLVALFEFALEPSRPERYVEIASTLKGGKKFSEEWERVTLNLLGRVQDTKRKLEDNHKDFYPLYKRYQSDEVYNEDIKELNELVNQKSNSVPHHSKKLLYWIKSNFNSKAREHLDDQTLKELMEWLKERELSKGLLPIFNYATRVESNRELCNLALDIVYDELSKGAQNITFQPDIFRYSWKKATEEEQKILGRFVQTFEKLLEDYGLFKLSRQQDLIKIYWSMLRASKMKEKHMVKMYQILRNFQKIKSPNLLSGKKEDIEEELLYFLQSDNPEVHRLAAVSLLFLEEMALFSHQNPTKTWRQAYDKIMRVEKEWVGERCWQIAKEENGDWKAKYIRSMKICDLKWSKNSKEWIEEIKTIKDSNIVKAWSGVIRKAGYCSSNDRDALYDFLLDILKSKETFDRTIFIATLDRLRDFVDEIEEVELDINEVVT